MYFENFSELTLESGIDIAPGINAALSLKHFHIRILIHFYINNSKCPGSGFSFKFLKYYQNLTNCRSDFES